MTASNSAKSRMERIIRLLEQIDGIKADIRDIYAEEKSDGGDKTAMGAAITQIRKREKDRTKFDDREVMVDAYLNAFASHTHAYARGTSEVAQGRGEGRSLPVQVSNPVLATNFPDPRLSVAADGQPSTPSPDADGAKKWSRLTGPTGQAVQAGSVNIESGHAVTNSSSALSSSMASEPAGTSNPSQAVPAGPNDDDVPDFLKRSHAHHDDRSAA